MKRKYRLSNRKRFFIFLFLLTTTILLISSFGAAAGNFEIKHDTVTVMAGDTLWGIAQQHAGNIDIRKYVYEMKKVNQLENAIIYAGQKLYLP